MKPRNFLMVVVLMLALVAQLGPAVAYGCLKARTNYDLVDDGVEWSISTAGAEDCIQSIQSPGIRVESIAVTSLPARGRVFLSGPSFRYVADVPGGAEADEFDLLVLGQVRSQEGFSTIRVKVNPNEFQPGHVEVIPSKAKRSTSKRNED
ncbi:hypothetical protein [uncultured Bradyrhizobium sp.]|jgi:hypothetical protein|uniref:hypothetical protein n=1 Tax=uncultured Bradyrhizobium sp. TaxID=199684 RepID=UPI00260FC939|nr:hypothetical protein [uncultured Bradyrhizobium sp.]